jgi:restriction endonuclease S subunit
MNDVKKSPKIRFDGFTDAWEQRKLGEVAKITMGQSPDGSTYSDTPSDYILVQGNADLKNGWVSPRIWTTQKTKTADAGDLIMSVRAPAGAMGKTAYDVVLGRGVAGIKGNEFLYQTLVKMDESGYWKKLAAGSTFESINTDSVVNAQIFMPQDIVEQEKIGSLFLNLDNLITLHQRKCEKLKCIKKSMLGKMFPKNGEQFPEIRFKGFTDAWEQRKLGDVVERVTRKNSNLESNLPLTISAQYGLIDQNEFFDRRIASKDVSGYYLIKHGEFAYNKSTSNDAEWGAIKRLDRYEKGVLSTLYIVFKILDEKQTSSDFLATYYDTNLWHKGIQAIAAEGARNHGLLNIAPSDFFNTSLMMPKSYVEQNKIGEFFLSLNKLITLHQRKYEKLTKIKKSFLQKLFV